MATTRKSNTGWYIAAAILIIVLIVFGVLAYEATRPSSSASPSPSASATASPSATASISPSPSSSETVTIDIYAKEVTSLTFGFGTSSGNETSPGPTITLKQGQTVTINFHNEGSMPHNVAVVTAKTDGNTNLAFSGAQVASANSPIAAGGTGSCAFTVDKTGTFYYICQVDAHVSLGMWGEVRVTE